MAFRRSHSETGDADQHGSGDLAHLIINEITWYMREHKVSRAELAQAMRVSPGRVSQVLSGDENLTLRTLSGVLAALGAHVDFSLRPSAEPADLFDSFEHPGEFDDDPSSPFRGIGSGA